jgi:Kef-type K+ transport system membrane component KefB
MATRCSCLAAVNPALGGTHRKETGTQVNTESLLTHVLVELMVIIGFARLGGIAFRAIGQPAVCGEIGAGLILGPSLLGGLFPEVSAEIFSDQTDEAFSVMSQIGLILLLFLIGIDFEFKHLRSHLGKPLVISAVGIILPFALGLGVGLFIQPEVAPAVPRLTFALFVALAISITALPTLGRILVEMGLNRAPLGVLAITSAAIDDAIGWTLLAFIIGIAQSNADVGKAVVMAAETFAYTVFLFIAARPVLLRWARSAVRRGEGKIGQTDLAFLLVLLFVSSLVTNQIGIFAIFGAFLLGAALSSEKEFREAVLGRFNDFVTVFFLPIFFTYTGLRTDVGSMGGLFMWALCGLVIAAAIVGKLGGGTLAARATGMSWRDASMIGVLMNTRGLMALIVVNVGLEAGILNDTAFFMLVMMAVVTTYMAAPLMRRLLSRAPKDSLSRVPSSNVSDGRWTQPELATATSALVP